MLGALLRNCMDPLPTKKKQTKKKPLLELDPLWQNFLNRMHGFSGCMFRALSGVGFLYYETCTLLKNCKNIVMNKRLVVFLEVFE